MTRLWNPQTRVPLLYEQCLRAQTPGPIVHCRHGSGTRAFTLIELLVTVAIIALLAAILLPSLSAAREAGRGSTCTTNLRQSFLACRMYADQHKGFGPAIGEPYLTPPNWALQVQMYAGRTATKTLYRAESVLVCPSVRAFYGDTMTRTYAMNATGHAGLPGDPDSYDDPARRGHIRFDRVEQPAVTPLLFDSARTPITGTAPPSPRTASMLDFRQQTHVDRRLGWFHRKGRIFNAVAFDGSCRAHLRVLKPWEKPLP